MQTDDLIDRLSENLEPAPKGLVARTLGLYLLAGAGVSTLLMLLLLHPRPDLAAAMSGGPFWMKFFYTFALAGLGLWIVERQARASADSRRPAWLVLVPVAALMVLAAVQLSAPGADTHHLMMGNTAKVCAALIMTLSLPIFVGVFAGLRQLAPTRLTLAGAGAGLLAGAAGSTIYGFHCYESAAPFIFIWYTLGILAATGLGALLGRWVLRW